MIFQCTNCRARFRVADEKVPDRGVKVRCTKCTVIFKVTRADAIDPQVRQPRSDRQPAPQAPNTPKIDAPPPADFGLDLDLNVNLASPPPRSRPAGTPQRQAARQLPAMPPMEAGKQAPPAFPSPADPFAALDLDLPPATGQPPAEKSSERGDYSHESSDPFAEFSHLSGFGAPPPADEKAHASATLDPFMVDNEPFDEDPFALPEPTTPAFSHSRAPASADPFAGLAAAEQNLEFNSEDDFASSMRQPDATSGGQIFDFGEFENGPRIDLNLDAATSTAQASGGELELAKKVGVPPASSFAPARRAFRRELASSLFNVTSAFIVGFAALVAIASLRSPHALTANDIGFDLVWIAMGYKPPHAESEQLRASSVRTGIYRTRKGEELFYVRGDIENTSSASYAAVQVVVEVFSSKDLIGRTESLGRLDAGPEDLYMLEDRDNNTLQKRLIADTSSLAVAARAKAPFIGVLPLTARQVDEAQIKISVTDGIPAALRASVVKKFPPEIDAVEQETDFAAVTEPP